MNEIDQAARRPVELSTVAQKSILSSVERCAFNLLNVEIYGDARSSLLRSINSVLQAKTNPQTTGSTASTNSVRTLISRRLMNDMNTYDRVKDYMDKYGDVRSSVESYGQAALDQMLVAEGLRYETLDEISMGLVVLPSDYSSTTTLYSPFFHALSIEFPSSVATGVGNLQLSVIFMQMKLFSSLDLLSCQC